MNSVAIEMGPAANDTRPTEDPLAHEYARLREVAKSHRAGAMYDKDRPFKETAKLIRQELAAAAKDEASPLYGIKIRVRSSRATHSRALDVDIIEVPLDRGPIVNPRRVEAELFDPHSFTGLPWTSRRGKRIESTVKAIVDQYGYDRSDIATDYYDVAFYVSVSFASEVTDAHRAEVERVVRLARG